MPHRYLDMSTSTSNSSIVLSIKLSVLTTYRQGISGLNKEVVVYRIDKLYCILQLAIAN